MANTPREQTQQTQGVNPKDLRGIKKAPLRLVPPALVAGTAPVMALGAEKYGPMNWRQYAVKLSVYLEAMERHLAAVLDGEWLDPESGEPHIFHISACVGIIADAQVIGKLDEDWPPVAGGVMKMLAEQDRSPSRQFTEESKGIGGQPAWDMSDERPYPELEDVVKEVYAEPEQDHFTIKFKVPDIANVDPSRALEDYPQGEVAAGVELPIPGDRPARETGIYRRLDKMPEEEHLS